MGFKKKRKILKITRQYKVICRIFSIFFTQPFQRKSQNAVPVPQKTKAAKKPKAAKKQLTKKNSKNHGCTAKKNTGTLGIERSRRTGTPRSLRFNHSATLSPTMSQLRHRRARFAGAPGGRKVCDDAASFATLCALLLCTAWEFLMGKNMTNIRF